MSLQAGDKLGPYEILAPIGKGGMGEVYRASDTQLKRDVAIKVLPAAFASDPSRMARFQREAEVLASLNHPNIAQIYGMIDDKGTRAIAMEFVEGESPTGPLPFDDAWKIMLQVAAGLEYAHERRVVHRDLKPANLKMTAEGRVKILDFGLAKAISGTGERREAGQDSPTLTIGATEVGVILGTAAYMAPEQVKGKEADRRADVWAFGVVLYELVTGERPFLGRDSTEVMARVVTQEPDITKVPARVRRLIGECLKKEPEERLRWIGDVARFLGAPDQDEMRSHYGQKLVPRFWPVAAAALAVLLALAGWGWWRATLPADPKPLVRLDVDLGTDLSLFSAGGADTILSPDGTRLVYASHNRLFTRRLDQLKSAELAGTEGAYAPFFSPDGQWVSFFSANKLKKISLEGSGAIDLCDISAAKGGSWGEAGNIIAALTNVGGLSRIPSVGGAPTPVTELAPGEATHRWPQILPGGKAVLFTSHSLVAAFDTANIEVATLADGRRKMLVRGGTFGRYIPSGHLVYVSRGSLFAVPFDLDRLEIRGTPVPVLTDVAYNVSDGYALLDFATASGTLVYRSGGATGSGPVVIEWLDANGKTQPLLTKPDYYLFPHLSPDGQRLAVSTTDLWVYEWPRGTMTRLTFGGAGISAPVWTPDSRYIVFRKLGEGVFLTRSDGAGTPQLLAQSKTLIAPWSITPDGKRLAFQDTAATTQYDLWTIPLEYDSTGLRPGKPEPFLQTQFNERHPSFSSDGRWLAYASDESGTYQIYVRAFPDKGGRWQISNNGGVYPVFSRNGRELFFRTEDNRIMVASYTAKGDSFLPDKPRVWSETRIANIGLNGSNFDVAPDGSRIAVLMPVERPEAQQSQSHVIFLENFFDEVRRRVPASRK